MQWSDENILTVLHLRDHEGMTCRKIGERFGVSKCSIIGVTSRIDRAMVETDTHEHMNGTMKPKWWKR